MLNPLAPLAEIYYFKPVRLQSTPLSYFLTLSQQTVLVSTMFLAIIAYVIGIFMAAVLPRNKYLNPVCYTVNVVFSSIPYLFISYASFHSIKRKMHLSLSWPAPLPIRHSGLKSLPSSDSITTLRPTQALRSFCYFLASFLVTVSGGCSDVSPSMITIWFH